MKKINIKTFNLLGLFKLNRYERSIIFLFSFGVFIVLNVLLSTLALRLDLSFGKAYTLAPSTKNILKNLDDIVNVKFFVSSDIPTKLLPLKNDVSDFLTEYTKASKGKLQVKILDPKKDQNALNEARELNIPELQFSQLERDKYAVTNSYFGISLSYANNREALPQVTEIESLEYNLSAAIYKLTRKEMVKIGLIGQPETNPQDDQQLGTFIKELAPQFIYGPLDFSEKSPVKKIDPTYKAVLVFDNNKKEYSKNELQILKEYLGSGGKAIFFVDGVWVQDNLSTYPVKHNLFSLLEEWGIKVDNSLALSTSAEVVNFGNGQMSFFTPYPLWIKTSSFNPKSSYFSNIRQLTYPWTSSLSVNKVDGYVTTELVKTSKNSWEQTGNFNLLPQSIPQPQQKDFKEITITAESKNTNGGHIIVFPTSRFILERFQNKNSSNIGAVLNMLSDMASGGALSGIRHRVVSFYPLPEIPENQKDIFKYLNILLLPALCAGYGALRLMKRK